MTEIDNNLKKVLLEIGGEGWFLCKSKKERKPIVDFISSHLTELLQSLIVELEGEKLETPDNGLAQWAEREKMGFNGGLNLAQERIKKLIK